jgi:hypothetical protein
MPHICGILNIPKWRKKGVISAKLPDHSRPQFHLSLLGALALMGMWRHLTAKVGTSKGRGKQWQTIPKNLSRNAACQSHTGRLTGLWFLPNRPKGWILIIIIGVVFDWLFCCYTIQTIVRQGKNVGNILLLLLLYTAIQLSLGGSSPYTSTDKANKNIYT